MYLLDGCELGHRTLRLYEREKLYPRIDFGEAKRSIVCSPGRKVQKLAQSVSFDDARQVGFVSYSLFPVESTNVLVAELKN